jgi:hypothetical protein
VVLVDLDQGRGSFDIVVEFAVRHDAVENAIRVSDPLLRQKDFERRATVGSELGGLEGGDQRRFAVESPTEIDPVAAEIVAAVEMIGVPFLKKFSSLENCLEVLSDNGPRGWQYCAFHGLRCSRAVAAAVLLERREEARLRLEKGREFLGARFPRDLPSFERAMALLQERLGRLE